MAFKLADRVRVTSTSTGTGAISLGSAMTGFQTFAATMAVGDTTYYAIVMGTQWETGIGTLTASTTLARTQVLESSAGGALVNFSAGTKDVYSTIPAKKFSFFDIGDTLITARDPGTEWVRASGQLLSTSSYPALATACGNRFAPVRYTGAPPIKAA